MTSVTTQTISPTNAILMMFLIAVWGSSFVVVKIALVQGLTPIAIATFRLLAASALFLTVLAVKKILDQNYSLHVNGKDLPRLIILALTGITFFFIAQVTGIALASASIAAILVCLLSPILIATLSARILRENLRKKQVTGIGIAAIGTFTVIAGGSLTLRNNASFLTGILVLLLTPLLWSTYTIVGKTMMKKYDPFLITAYANVIGGLCLIPFSIAENSLDKIMTMNLQAWTAILFLAFTASFIGYFIWFNVASQVKAAVLSSFLFAEPLITALLATTLIGETITLYTAVGGVLIFLGVYLVSRNQTNLHQATRQSFSG
jgi:drug/metabolite transporter (DMT)-like permease